MGYLAVMLGVIAATMSPAKGYELSIYSGTPTLFWMFLGTALIVAIVTILSAPVVLEQQLGAILGGLTIQTIAFLPVIRGYHFFGGDSLRHLGMAIDISNGAAELTDNIYFGLHVVSIFTAKFVSLPLEWSFMFISIIFVGLFMIFAYLCINRLIPDAQVPAIAVFSVLLLLPLNQVTRAGVFLQPYPTTVALFFAPVFLFCIVGLSTQKTSSWILLLMMTFLSALFFHPQQAANLLILSIGIVLSHYGLHIMTTNRTSLKPIVIMTVIVGLITWLWVSSHARFSRALSGLVISILTNPGTTGDIRSAAFSLENVGGCLEEIFVKLFLISLIYCLTAGGLVISYTWRLFSSQTRRNYTKEQELQLHFGVGLIPIIIVFISYLAFSSQYFRHLGFIMVITTILGAIGLHLVLGHKINSKSSKILSHTIFCLIIVLSVMTMYPSGFIYQPNTQVSEGSMTGYESTFKFTKSSDIFVGVRGTP
jgi:hypothetical protein